MKKNNLVLTVLVLGMLVFLSVGCGPGQKTGQSQVLYHCTMHPQIIRDHPGKCPICGMDLVPFTPPATPEATKPGLSSEGSAMTMPQQDQAVEVDVRRQQLIGVKTVVATRRTLEKTLRVQGEVAHDPEMYQAQAEYLRGLAAGGEGGLQSASRLKLEHMGMSPDLIRRLERRGRPQRNLFVRDQDPVFWIYVYFYEADLPFLSLGQPVAVRVPRLGGQHDGVLRGLQPYVEPAARTIRGIVEVRDPELRLYAGLYADAEVRLTLPEAVVIPASAVLDSGTRQVVFELTGPGRFEPREVQIGAVAGEFAQVLTGVEAGASVVTDGNFMLDAESRLQSVVKETAPAGHQH
ncbi:MAG: heavy metal-binding domain-containing protein [candidate division FCPU426 bacterium]